MSTRITNSMMVNTFMRNLTNNSNKMNKLQSQLATGKQHTRLSDDPVSVVKLLDARAKQNDIGQYQTNLRDAKAWLTQTESALIEMNGLIQRVYELSVYAANDVLGTDERRGIADEIAQIRDQVVTLGNTTLGDKYIFGGYNVSYPPFAADSEESQILANGIDMVGDEGDLQYMMYEINFGVDFEVAISPTAFMGVGEDDNIYYQMNELHKVLSGSEGDPQHAEIQPFIDSMLRLQRNVLAQVAEVGGRSARIELMEERYAMDMINYTQIRSDVEDLDQAEGIMNFTMAESVYRAALSVGGRVLPPTLMDFLR